MNNNFESSMVKIIIKIEKYCASSINFPSKRSNEMLFSIFTIFPIYWLLEKVIGSEESSKRAIAKNDANSTSKSTTSVKGRFSGKVAIVTASTEGIGFAIAKRLLSEGAKVVISSRKQENVDVALKSLKMFGHQNVSGIVCHVGNSEDRQKLYKETINKFGGIDILISNAAVNPFIGFTPDCSEEMWDKIFDINLKSSFLLTKEVLPYLIKKKSGSIVFITSLSGIQHYKTLGPYSISKTALLALTKVLSEELAPMNIRVNAIAPGLIGTKFAQHICNNEIAIEKVLSQVPMNRVGVPSDIDGVAAFLCSEDAKYITGETIVVSGGMQSRL